MIFRLYLLSLCTALVACGIIRLSDCPAGEPDTPRKKNIVITRLTVTGCVAGQVCRVRRGVTYYIRGNATFYYRVRTLRARASVNTVLGLLQVYDENLCDKFLPGSKNCTNIEPGDECQLKYSVTVDKNLPNYKGVVRVLGTDDNKKVYFCGELEVALED